MVYIRAESVSLRYPTVTNKGSFLAKAREMVGGQINQADGRTFVHALNNISFELKSGERCGLIGLNGSGKTTLLKVLSGIFVPSKGHVEREGLVLPFLSANFGVDKDLTARENFHLKASIAGIDKNDKETLVEKAVEVSGLGEFVDYPVRTYSAGMIARVGISSIMMEKPDILIMDEWIGTGDALFRETATKIIDEFASTAKILILASHSMALLERWTDKCIWLHKGEIRAFGATDEVSKIYSDWVAEQAKALAV